MMRRPKFTEQLSSDPVTVDIGEEKVELFHFDPTIDAPNINKSLISIVRLMKEKRDWQILPDFLEELHKAKHRLKPHQWEFIVRRANHLGMQGAITTCIIRAHKTGLVLRSPELVRQVMWGGYLLMRQGDWTEEAINIALAYTERIARLLDSPSHCGQGVPRVKDPRIQSDIIGLLLLLAAVRADRHHGGRDEDGKVAKYSERLKASIERPGFVWPSSDTTFSDQALGNSKPVYVARYEMQRWVPVWKGMDLASNILPSTKPELATWLKDVTPLVHRWVEEARDIVERGETPFFCSAFPPEII